MIAPPPAGSCGASRREHGGQILLARDELTEDGTPAIDGERLADYAEALGKRADQLAQEDPLRPPGRVAGGAAGGRSAARHHRAGRQPPTASSPPPPRANAALSSRLELYPRGMPAARALKLALGALAGAKELTAEQVRERVAGRYPEAEPLPDRPDLDALLEDAGSELNWQPGCRGREGGLRLAPAGLHHRVVRHRPHPHDQRRPALRGSAGGQGRDRPVRAAPALLVASTRDSWPCVVSPGRVRRWPSRSWSSEFPLEVCSLDGLLIRHMKAFTAEKRVDWRMVLRADAVPAAERGASRDWGNLQRVVRSALPRVKAELAESPRHVLLTNPGLLARYGQLDLLGDLMQEHGSTRRAARALDTDPFGRPAAEADCWTDSRYPCSPAPSGRASPNFGSRLTNRRRRRRRDTRRSLCLGPSALSFRHQSDIKVRHAERHAAGCPRRAARLAQAEGGVSPPLRQQRGHRPARGRPRWSRYPGATCKCRGDHGDRPPGIRTAPARPAQRRRDPGLR